VKVGAVGYHQKPSGSFVTLFDAFNPIASSGGRADDIVPLSKYDGDTTISSQRLEKRTALQRRMDKIQDWFRPKEGTAEYNLLVVTHLE
jgi:abelson tyrosine-protein kinase 1